MGEEGQSEFQNICSVVALDVVGILEYIADDVGSLGNVLLA